MCGIVGFVSNEKWKSRPDISWLNNIVDQLNEFLNKDAPLDEIELLLKNVADHFEDLASFGLYMELIDDPGIRSKVDRMIRLLKQLKERIEEKGKGEDSKEGYRQAVEIIKDYLWQLESETVGLIDRTFTLFPESLSPSQCSRSQHFVAWSIEHILENLDRSEIRGRDSAGLSILSLLPRDLHIDSLFNQEQREDFEKRQINRHLSNSSVTFHPQPDGQLLCGFIYKAANLVGQLGDNTRKLRTFIRRDQLLWTAAAYTTSINIVAHTRWASNGIISIPNCHPVDGVIEGDDNPGPNYDRDALFVLNGDVDNYNELVEEVVESRGYHITPSISTDAKILPVFYCFNTPPGVSPEKRFSMTMNHAEGSLAVVMQHPAHPHKLYMALKGSGQSLFAGRTVDGLILSSEVYGLCSRTRCSYALSGLDKGGTIATLVSENSQEDQIAARYLEVNEVTAIDPEIIEIYARDIVREPYEYYFEKEVSESVESVRKTITGKYKKKDNNRIEFLYGSNESLEQLIGRLRNPEVNPIRRIIAIGQGTAAVAAMGVAYLIGQALKRSILTVDYIESPELSGFLSEDNMEDLLLIPISQSGTTTDTNRTVDIARAKGAWVHAIVNRRNSPLVKKAHSYLYTSDGRDVEMAVASTKAFYSQIAAGKIMALMLAQEFKSLTAEEIYREIQTLETLPEKIKLVLDLKDMIAVSAEKYALTRHNWAIVGNGPNKIAGKEIRIKLSELCYKSIPFDITEDKKHIDLSTEPLTIVVANDLPHSIIRDTIKEVSIFKAHNGSPIVFCSEGEKGFNEYAESVIPLPRIEGNLGFVLATVAGHLWGFYAAKALDRQSIPMQNLRTLMFTFLEEPHSWDKNLFQANFYKVLDLIKNRKLDASLPASAVGKLLDYVMRLEISSGNSKPPGEEMFKEGIFILKEIINETRRTIDSIRHQAKTVTVGTSRPGKKLSSLWLTAFDELTISIDQIVGNDMDLLRTLSPVLSDIEGGMLFESTGGQKLKANSHNATKIRIIKRFGCSVGVPSNYDTPRVVSGLKRKVARLSRAYLSPGKKGQQNLLILPVFDNIKYVFNKIALFHLSFVSQTSSRRKLNILKELRKYNDFIEYLEETRNTSQKEEILMRISPRDLIYKPIQELVGENGYE
jgi:glucosamine--fructose-6-phosphate aminotransferase (isomerizing)